MRGLQEGEGSPYAKTAEKSNEIEGLPRLLNMRDIKIASSPLILWEAKKSPNDNNHWGSFT